MTRYYMARDANGELWMYNYKPVKSEKAGYWFHNGKTRRAHIQLNLHPDLESSDSNLKKIKWEDDEPTLFLMCR